LTWHAKNHPVTQIKYGVLLLPKDHRGSAFRQVELHPLLFALHQPTRGHFACRGCVLASRLASALHDVPQRGKVHLGFALVACDDLPLRPCGKLGGLPPLAEAPSRLDWSGPWAWRRPLPMEDVVPMDAWGQGARRAGLPAPTQHWGVRMARGIRDPAMAAVVVLLFYPQGV
jgi:hypothetical protein